jgi:hypothetical protein
MERYQYLIVCGNPIDGFRYIGPFTTHDDAADYLDRTPNRDEPMWITDLDEPEAL